MKISSDILKNITITTDAGNFKIDGNGITDVPDEVAQTLVADGTFIKVEEVKSAKVEKSEADESKADTKKVASK